VAAACPAFPHAKLLVPQPPPRSLWAGQRALASWGEEENKRAWGFRDSWACQGRVLGIAAVQGGTGRRLGSPSTHPCPGTASSRPARSGSRGHRADPLPQSRWHPPQGRSEGQRAECCFPLPRGAGEPCTFLSCRKSFQLL